MYLMFSDYSTQNLCKQLREYNRAIKQVPLQAVEQVPKITSTVNFYYTCNETERMIFSDFKVNRKILWLIKTYSTVKNTRTVRVISYKAS